MNRIIKSIESRPSLPCLHFGSRIIPIRKVCRHSPQLSVATRLKFPGTATDLTVLSLCLTVPEGSTSIRNLLLSTVERPERPQKKQIKAPASGGDQEDIKATDIDRSPLVPEFLPDSGNEKLRTSVKRDDDTTLRGRNARGQLSSEHQRHPDRKLLPAVIGSDDRPFPRKLSRCARLFSCDVTLDPRFRAQH